MHAYVATELCSNENQEEARQRKHGPVILNCTTCHGKGSIELPADEILNLLKERLIA